MSKHEQTRARFERGQALVIVGAALVGLLVLAGLAIDGGSLFMERRRAQNAADAGALAGARLIGMAMMTCDEIDYGDLDDDIARAVNERAEDNGIRDTNGAPGDQENDNVVAYYVNPGETRLALVGGGEVPLGTSGVEVEVRDQHRTHFLVVIGIRHIPSSAEAMAMTGVVRNWPASMPLLPIGVPQVVLDAVQADTGECGIQWEMHDTGDGEFCYQPLDPETCLPEGDPICPEDPGSPHNALRGWLNFNYIYNVDYITATHFYNRTYENSLGTEGCQEAPKLPGLAGWCSMECSDRLPPIFAGTSCYADNLDGCAFYDDGDFVHGQDGSKTTSLTEVYDSWGGSEVACPVFDVAYLQEDLPNEWGDGAESPTVYRNWANGDEWTDINWPNGGDFPTAGGGGSNNWFYHIVGFVTATIPEDDKENKILYGEFKSVLVQSGEIEPVGLTGTCSLLTHGVTLWR
ncbi:MAG: hypothetical protein JXA09_16775 [Anaerolineae bacterium]|nr:hypothetical protein [Anaerolineae bacterium]